MRNHSATPTAPRRRSTGFTLVELLVVMAIASVLLGLLVLGVRGFNGSVNRRSAVGTLMGVFDQARTVAISEGRPTYVVFVSAPSGNAQNNTGSGGVPTTMWGRAYAVFQDPVLQDTSTTTDFLPQQRSKWLYLPTGFAFKSDSSSMASVTNSSPASDDTTKFKVMASAGGQTSLWLPYVKFDSAGQIVDYRNQVLDPSSTLLRVLLFEGTASGAGAETSYRRGVATTGANAKYAVDEILLKPITGRARYTLDPANNLASSN